MNDLTDRPEARTPFAEATEAPADRLSRLWDRGERPALDDFLKQSGPLSAEELASVIRADQRRRWLSGERVLAETYFRACPRLRDDLDSVTGAGVPSAVTVSVESASGGSEG